MTFNDDARINSSKVKRRGATGGVVAGGGIGVAIIVFLIAQFTGFDLSGVVPSDQPAGPDQTVAECDNISGEEANKTVDCRMAGAALVIDSYWAEELPALGGTYVTPEFILFEQSVSTACGNARCAAAALDLARVDASVIVESHCTKLVANPPCGNTQSQPIGSFHGNRYTHRI